jgi:hypothetical protein
MNTSETPVYAVSSDQRRFWAVISEFKVDIDDRSTLELMAML